MTWFCAALTLQPVHLHVLSFHVSRSAHLGEPYHIPTASGISIVLDLEQMEWMQRNQEISVEALHVITPRLYDIDMSDKYLFFYIFFVFGKAWSLEALQSYFDLT